MRISPWCSFPTGIIFQKTESNIEILCIVQKIQQGIQCHPKAQMLFFGKPKYSCSGTAKESAAKVSSNKLSIATF
jgi:hypothetical protein